MNDPKHVKFPWIGMTLLLVVSCAIVYVLLFM